MGPSHLTPSLSYDKVSTHWWPFSTHDGMSRVRTPYSKSTTQWNASWVVSPIRGSDCKFEGKTLNTSQYFQSSKSGLEMHSDSIIGMIEMVLLRLLNSGLQILKMWLSFDYTEHQQTHACLIKWRRWSWKDWVCSNEGFSIIDISVSVILESYACVDGLNLLSG